MAGFGEGGTRRVISFFLLLGKVKIVVWWMIRLGYFLVWVATGRFGGYEKWRELGRRGYIVFFFSVWRVI